MIKTKKGTKMPCVGHGKNEHLARKTKPVIKETVGEEVGNQAEAENRTPDQTKSLRL